MFTDETNMMFQKSVIYADAYKCNDTCMIMHDYGPSTSDMKYF